MPISFLILSSLHPLTILPPPHPLRLTLFPCTLPPILFLMIPLLRRILKGPNLGQGVNNPSNRNRNRNPSNSKITVT